MDRTFISRKHSNGSIGRLPTGYTVVEELWQGSKLSCPDHTLAESHNALVATDADRHAKRDAASLMLNKSRKTARAGSRSARTEPMTRRSRALMPVGEREACLLAMPARGDAAVIRTQATGNWYARVGSSWM